MDSRTVRTVRTVASGFQFAHVSHVARFYRGARYYRTVIIISRYNPVRYGIEWKIDAMPREIPAWVARAFYGKIFENYGFWYSAFFRISQRFVHTSSVEEQKETDHLWQIIYDVRAFCQSAIPLLFFSKRRYCQLPRGCRGKEKKCAPKLDRNLKALRCLNCIAAIASCIVTWRDNGRRMEIRVVGNFIIVRFAFAANERWLKRLAAIQWTVFSRGYNRIQWSMERKGRIRCANASYNVCQLIIAWSNHAL